MDLAVRFALTPNTDNTPNEPAVDDTISRRLHPARLVTDGPHTNITVPQPSRHGKRRLAATSIPDLYPHRGHTDTADAAQQARRSSWAARQPKRSERRTPTWANAPQLPEPRHSTPPPLVSNRHFVPLRPLSPPAPAAASCIDRERLPTISALTAMFRSIEHDSPSVPSVEAQLDAFVQRLPAPMPALIQVLTESSQQRDPRQLAHCIFLLDFLFASAADNLSQEPTLNALSVLDLARVLVASPTTNLQLSTALLVSLPKAPGLISAWATLRSLVSSFASLGEDTVAHLHALSQASPFYDRRMDSPTACQMVGMIRTLNCAPSGERAALADQVVRTAVTLLDRRRTLEGVAMLAETLAHQPPALRDRLVDTLCALPSLELAQAPDVVRHLRAMPIRLWADAWQQAIAFENMRRQNLANAHLARFQQRYHLPQCSVDYIDERMFFLELYCRVYASNDPAEQMMFQAAQRLSRLGGLRDTWTQLQQQTPQQRQRTMAAVNRPQGAAGRVHTHHFGDCDEAIAFLDAVYGHNAATNGG